MKYLLLVLAFLPLLSLRAMDSNPQKDLFKTPTSYAFDSQLFSQYKNMSNDKLDQELYRLGEGRQEEGYSPTLHAGNKKKRAYAQLAYVENNKNIFTKGKTPVEKFYQIMAPTKQGALEDRKLEEQKVVAGRFILAQRYSDTRNYIINNQDKFKSIEEFASSSLDY